MPKRNLVKDPNFSDVKEVANITETERKIAQDLIDTMSESQSQCLSAPSIGASKMILVLRDSSDSTYTEMFNPVILDGFGKAVVSEPDRENPGEFIDTLRARMIFVNYQDSMGNPVEKIYLDYEAYSLQIEVDRLNGLLRTVEKKLSFNPPPDDDLEKYLFLC
jgi:peptide deformylase